MPTPMRTNGKTQRVLTWIIRTSDSHAGECRRQPLRGGLRLHPAPTVSAFVNEMC
jgi:hypothetical protein